MADDKKKQEPIVESEWIEPTVETEWVEPASPKSNEPTQGGAIGSKPISTSTSSESSLGSWTTEANPLANKEQIQVPLAKGQRMPPQELPKDVKLFEDGKIIRQEPKKTKLGTVAFDLNEVKRKVAENPVEPIPLTKDQAFNEVKNLEKRASAVDSLEKGQSKIFADNQLKLVDTEAKLKTLKDQVEKAKAEGNIEGANQLIESAQPLIAQYDAQARELRKQAIKLDYLDKRKKTLESDMIGISEGQQYTTNQWQALNSGLNNLTAGVLRAPSFVYNSMIALQNKIAKETGIPISANPQTDGYLQQAAQYFQDNADAYNKVIEKKKAQTDYSIQNLLERGEILKAFNLLSESVMESAPTTAAIALSGMAGVGTFGTTMGGAAVFGNQTFEENKKNGIDDNTNYLNSWVNGTLEGIFEATGTLQIVKHGADLFKKEGKKAVEETAKTLWEQVYGKVAKKMFPATSAVLEGVSEAETAFTQNYVNMISGVDTEYKKDYNNIVNSDMSDLDKEDALSELTKKHLFQGVPDAFYVGSAMGGGMGLMQAKQGYTAVNDTRRNEIKKSQETLDNLNKTLTNPLVSSDAKDIIQSKADEEAAKIAALVEQDDADLRERLTKDEYEKVTDLQVKIETLETSLGSIDDKDSKAIVEQQIKELQSQKREFLNNAFDSIALRLQEKRKELGIEVDPLEDLPETVVNTFDRIEANLPTDINAVQEASDYLYRKYKELQAMKNSKTRLLTIPQIDAYMAQLDEDITKLEDYKNNEREKSETTLKKNTSPTNEKYGTINRNDGKGIVDLTKEEYLKKEGLATPEAAAGVTIETLSNADLNRIIEIESMLSSDNASMQKTGDGNLIKEARQELILELAELKKKASVVVNEQPQSKDAAAIEPTKEMVEAGTTVITPNLPTIELNTPNPFNKELEKLGYQQSDIDKMTMEQKQEIVTNKTQAPIVESSAKVDSTKENAKQEKIAAAQAQLDQETTAENESNIQQQNAKEENIEGDANRPSSPATIESTAKALEEANKNKVERFYPDDKVILTTKDGKEVEVSFRGYNGENKAVVFGSRGSGINQMEVDISQLRAKSKSDKLSKEDRKELLSKIDFQDKNAPSYSEDFTDKELQDLSVKYPKESKLTNKEKQERNDLQIATTPLKRWQEQEYGVDDPNDPINIRLAKEHETAINNIITNDKYSTLISEAYHKAKADGSNPELVQAVESLLSKEQAPASKEQIESTAKALEEVRLTDIDNILGGEGNKNIPLSEVVENKNDKSLEDAIRKVKLGIGSRTKGAIIVRLKSDGKFHILDGHHRAAEAILRGDKTINADVEFEVNTKKMLSEFYHKAKAKPETTRTEQEQELVQAVESLLSKEQTPKQDTNETKNTAITADAGQVQPPNVDSEVAKDDTKGEVKAVEKRFTDAKDLNEIYAKLKAKYGDKKGAEIYQVADRLVNPNTNTIIDIRSNGVVVKEDGNYLFKPFTNTDANSKKWTLGKPLNINEQYKEEVKPTATKKQGAEIGDILPDIKTDLKTVLDELRLDEFDGQLHEIYKEARGDKETYDKLIEDKADQLSNAQSDIDDKITELKNKNEDLIIDQDNIEDSAKSKAKKEKEWNAIEKQIEANKKEIEALKDETKRLSEIEEDLRYGYAEFEDAKAISEKIDGRLATRRNVQQGVDLFPNQAAIKEYKSAKAKLKKQTDAKTIRGFEARTADQVTKSEPIIEVIESKAASDNETELNEAIQEADNLINEVKQEKELNKPKSAKEKLDEKLREIDKKYEQKKLEDLMLRKPKQNAILSTEGIAYAVEKVMAYIEYGGLSAKEAIDKVAEFFSEKGIELDSEDIASIGNIVNPPSGEKPNFEGSEGEGKEKKHKLGIRVELSTKMDEKIQKGLLKDGIKYLEKAMELSNADAKRIIDAYEAQGDLNELADYIMNPTNKISGDVKVALEQQLYKKYAEKAAAAEGEMAEYYRQKAIDILNEGMKTGMDAGRAVNMQKGWQDITGKDPEGLVQAAYDEFNKQNEGGLRQHEEAIRSTKEMLDELLATEEGQELLKQQISEEVDAQVEALTTPLTQKAKERADKAVKAIKSFRATIKANVYSDAFGIVAAIDTALNLIEKSISGGASVAQAIERGVNYINKKMNGKEWNEKKFRADVEQGFKDNGIEVTKDAKKAVKTKDAAAKLKSKIKDLDAIIANPEKAIADLEAKKARAEARQKEKDGKSDEVKKLEAEIKLKSKIVKLLEGMDTLTDKQKKNIISDALDTIIKNGYLSDIKFRNIVSKALGFDHLTEKDEAAIREGANVIAEVTKAQDAFLKDPSKENKAAYEKAVFKGRKANENVSRYFREKPNFADRFSTFIRGNLLSTSTVVLSAVSNIATMPSRWLQNGTASAIDFMRFQLSKIDYLSKNSQYFKNQRYNKFLANQRGYYAAMPKGFIDGVKEMLTGAMPDEVFEREMKGGLHPLEAWQRIYNSATGKEKQKMGKNLLDLAEGTLGVAPEVVFRLLNVTDKPFRKATYNAVVSELVEAELENEKKVLETKKNLTDEEKQLLADINSGVEFKRRMVISGDEITEQAKYEAAAAVFQNKNILVEGVEALTGKIAKIISEKGKNKTVNKQENKLTEAAKSIAKGSGKILGTTVFPFINMPLNWGTEVFMLSNPIVPIMVGGFMASKGDTRKANQYFGKAVLGMILTQGVGWLIANGLINGSGSDDDDKEKTGTFGLKKGYNRINISAYKRVMAGGSPQWQEGDYTREYYQMGIMGAVANAHANTYEKYGQASDFLTGTMNEMFGSIRTSLNMPMVQSANMWLDAFAKGDERSASKILVNTANALKAPFFPATVRKAILANNSEEVLRITKDESVSKWIENTYKDQLGIGKDIPLRYTVWGQPIRKTPKGENAWVYNLFDITKGMEINNDYFGLELYQLHDELRKSNPELAKDVLPSTVDNNVSYLGVNHKLTSAEQSEFQLLVGRNQRTLAEIYMADNLLDSDGNKVKYSDATNEQKAANLKAIYEVSLKEGKAQFAALKGWSKDVAPKKEKAEVSKKKLSKILKAK
jgi:hypothetical protein